MRRIAARSDRFDGSFRRRGNAGGKNCRWLRSVAGVGAWKCDWGATRSRLWRRHAFKGRFVRCDGWPSAAVTNIAAAPAWGPSAAAGAASGSGVADSDAGPRRRARSRRLAASGEIERRSASPPVSRCSLVPLRGRSRVSGGATSASRPAWVVSAWASWPASAAVKSAPSVRFALAAQAALGGVPGERGRRRRSC
ncbi:MAG: hypothetical protein MZW92_52510 [Comamonadaceae bacterium]|nr:hypothetical protein [Comamonadaceae bacterium]